MTHIFKNLALLILLACCVSRPFLSEMPFRTSAVKSGDTATVMQKDEILQTDKLELARVTFPIGILLAAALWACSVSFGKLPIRFGWLGLLILIFAAITLAGAMYASNKRVALEAWLEQVSLLTAGFLATQLVTNRRAFIAVVIVLIALAGTMAVKASWEYFVETPDRIKSFDEDPAKWYASVNAKEGSPQAKALFGRVHDTSAIGYISMSNLFGSLMILLAGAAVGACLEKFRAARVDFMATAAKRGKGEIHLPTLAAILLAIIAAGTVCALVMTRSRGAIIAAIIASIAGTIIYRYRRALSRNWKKSLLITAGIFVLGLGAVAAYGITYDTLPTKTMAFRWQYWKASTQIVKDHPLLGVGAGNFPAAYLQYREPAAEESVKNPHNLFMHAATEFGLPAATIYFVIIASFMILICQPPRQFAPTSPPESCLEGRWMIATLAALAASVLISRSYFGGYSDGLLFLLEAVLPAVLFAVMMGIGYWAMGSFITNSAAPMTFVRIAGGCACGAFILADMVSFGFFLPSTAAVFWLLAGSTAGNFNKSVDQ